MRFRKNIRSFFAFSFGTLLATASVTNAKSVDIINFTEAFNDGFDGPGSPELAAALMMIDLYDQGLAGGASGICIDFDHTNGRTSVKVGFSTSAFVTGSSQLKDTKLDFDSSRLRKLIEVIAKAQGGKVNASVAGYADGQHYRNANGLNQSIEKNKDLSQRRARQIASLLDKKYVNVGSSKGYASPELEQDSRFTSGQGLACPTRRKVVITLDAPNANVSEVSSPVRNFVPDSLNADLKAKARKDLQTEIRSINRGLSGSIKVKTAWIYEELKKRGRLIAGCDQKPLKQLTQAFISASIDNIRTVDDWVRTYVNDGDFKAQSATAKGMGSLIFACVRPSKEWLEDVVMKHPDFITGGKEFFGLENGVSLKGEAKIQFDASRLHQDHVENGDYQGTSQRGYFCKTCGSGLFFAGPDTHGHFKPRYIDRAVKAVNPKQDVTLLLNQLEDQDPFSFGAFLKPRMFVIKDCRDCACDPMKRVENKDPSVSKIDPLLEQDQVKLSASELDAACMIRPPLLYTCSSTQNEQADEDDASLNRVFQYTDLSGVQRTASSLNELLNGSKQVCEGDRVISPREKISRVSCSTDASRRLPSQNEKADCAEYIKGI